MIQNSISAFIWDYDGTLADTRHKNLNVTRKIIEYVTAKSADEYPVLRSLDSYDSANKNSTNWKEV